MALTCSWMTGAPSTPKCPGKEASHLTGLDPTSAGHHQGPAHAPGILTLALCPIFKQGEAFSGKRVEEVVWFVHSFNWRKTMVSSHGCVSSCKTRRLYRRDTSCVGLSGECSQSGIPTHKMPVIVPATM